MEILEVVVDIVTFGAFMVIVATSTSAIYDWIERRWLWRRFRVWCRRTFLRDLDPRLAICLVCGCALFWHRRTPDSESGRCECILCGSARGP